MLITSVILAIVRFSAANGPLLDAPSFPKPSPNGTPIAPGEPSTLILALIGIGLIGVYVATKRRFRLQKDSRQISATLADADVSRVETTTRGAA